jgi:hypothetical protein
MSEEINDLDLLIEAFGKVLGKELKFVQNNGWLGELDFRKKENMFGMHKQITVKVVDQADKIYKKSLEVGRNSEEAIKEVLDKAKEFFDIFSNKIDSYIEETDFLTDGDDSTREIAFQSELTKAQFALQEKIKKIFSATTSASLDIQLFNNVKIPPILSEMAEKANPEIRDFIELKRKSLK